MCSYIDLIIILNSFYVSCYWALDCRLLTNYFNRPELLLLIDTWFIFQTWKMDQWLGCGGRGGGMAWWEDNHSRGNTGIVTKRKSQLPEGKAPRAQRDTDMWVTLGIDSSQVKSRLFYLYSAKSKQSQSQTLQIPPRASAQGSSAREKKVLSALHQECEEKGFILFISRTTVEAWQTHSERASRSLDSTFFFPDCFFEFVISLLVT